MNQLKSLMYYLKSSSFQEDNRNAQSLYHYIQVMADRLSVKPLHLCQEQNAIVLQVQLSDICIITKYLCIYDDDIYVFKSVSLAGNVINSTETNYSLFQAASSDLANINFATRFITL
jgi:hypothetical protein